MSEDPGHLSDKLDHLDKRVTTGFERITEALTEFRIGLERRLSAIDVKQGILDGLGRQLIQVGEHRARISALELSAEANQRHANQKMALLFFCLVAVLIYLKFLPS